MPDSPRIGVVGIPGKWSTEVLADRIEEHSGYRRVIDIRDITVNLNTGAIFHHGFDLRALDALVIKKITAEYSPASLDRLDLLSLAQQAGVRIFSPLTSIRGLINRLSCSLLLAENQIPMPQTRLCESTEEAVSIVQEFGAAVFKPLFSTKARGMCVLQADQSDLHQRIEQFSADGNPLMYIQQRLDLPGRDLGLVFVGGKYLCAYARIAGDDSWNTTIHSGGQYAGCEPDADMIELAQRAQAPFKLDFTTVDVAETENGPIVFEVSAFGGFRGAQEGCGMDAAAHYSKHILQSLKP